MATTSEEIRLVVKSEMDKAIKDLKKFNTGLKNTEKGSTKLAKDFKSLGASFLKVGVVVTGVALALKKTVDAASDLEEVTGKFNTVFSDSPDL